MGFMPILAHPERVEALQREPAEIDRLIEMGVKLQLNSWCLAEPMDSPLFQTATRLMREQKYFLMGTDCHNSHTLRPRLRGVEIAVELFGESVVEKLTVTNPGLLMKKHRP
jgi:protein-tyrosine phosphatase